MKKSMVLFFLCSLFVCDLSAQCNNFSRPGVHVVKSGENLFRIAKRYNVSILQLAQWNNIPTDITLYACQELSVSGSSTYENNAPAYNSSDEFTTRGNSNYSGPSFVKQSGNKHIIREGETISGLANLYGYTEERFRRINLLKAGEELSVGSSILSTDCTCDRVVSYEEMNGGTTYSRPSNTTYSNNSDRYNANTGDSFQDRGRSSYENYDDFYDNNNGSFGGSTPPAAEPINNNQIRSAGTTPNAYDNRGANTSVRNNATNRGSGAPAPVRATYMSADELAMLDEINLMRSNPTGYIAYVEQYRKDIQSGRTFGSSLPVIDELIAELRRTPALSILEPAPCIYEAARKHGLDQKARGYTGHDGSDGSWPWERVKRACSQMSDGNENLVGGLADVRESVILLLVDDGISSRGHRKTLLEPKWRYGATYKVGKVGHMPNCWVQKFGS